MTLKFDMHLGSSAAEVPVKFQSDMIILRLYLVASRHDGKMYFCLVNRDPGIKTEMSWDLHTKVMSM